MEGGDEELRHLWAQGSAHFRCVMPSSAKNGLLVLESQAYIKTYVGNRNNS